MSHSLFFFLFFLFFFFHFFSTEKSFESGPESEFILKMNKETLQTLCRKGVGTRKGEGEVEGRERTLCQGC